MKPAGTTAALPAGGDGRRNPDANPGTNAAADAAVDAAARQRLRLWLRLLKLSRRVEAQLRERLRSEFRTTLPRFDVLAALDRHEPRGLRMSELSAALKVSNGNVTVVVDRLVADGLVLRETVAGDRRATLARLTPRGRAAFAELAAAHRRWIDELLAGIEPDQAAGVIALLDGALPPASTNEPSRS